LFQGQLPPLAGFLTYLAATAALALSALWLFTRLRRGFADVL
jgi:ABC-type polysaccharide/polyol phosphate export permease